jgi:hypothetical protein
MSPEIFHVPATPSRAEVFARLNRLLARLPADKMFTIEVRPHRARRSLSQNALMWALFEQIIAKGGEAMAGWTKDDVKDFMCGECFGWERTQVFGRPRMRAVHGTSDLNKQQMSDFLDWVVRFMAERGVVLDLPNEEQAA